MREIDVFEIVAIVVACVIPALLGAFAFWVYSRKRSETIRSRAEVQQKVIEKFGSLPEFSAFLETGGGKKLMELEEKGRLGAGKAPAEKIVSAVQRGIILIVTGIMGVVLCVGELSRDNRNAFKFAAASALVLALGIGHIAASIVSLKLSRKLGLMNTDK